MPEDSGRKNATLSMRMRAFAILGVPPTSDGRAIRSAFLRLARIYHPDRFVDMPDDVRDEAERRMKDATVAYEILRASSIGYAKRRSKHPIDETELRELTRLYRDAIEARRTRDKKDRERWQRWDEVERLARERSEREAEMAARIASEIDGPLGESESEPVEPTPIGRRSQDSFPQRIDAARRGQTSPSSHAPRTTTRTKLRNPADQRDRRAFVERVVAQ